MSYLNENDIMEIQDNVRLLSIKDIDDISHYLFDSHIEEYNTDTPDFYVKNGFVENLSNKRRNAKHTISMRKDIFVD